MLPFCVLCPIPSFHFLPGDGPESLSSTDNRHAEIVSQKGTPVIKAKLNLLTPCQEVNEQRADGRGRKSEKRTLSQ
jgi:hypothetical protein